MQIRFATQSDALDIYQWRNDPLSRKMFINDNEVSIQEHLDWFSNALQSESSIILVGWINDEKIGVCRFDIDLELNTAEVSINLNPRMRGKSLSKIFLSSSIDFFLEQHHIGLVARIKKVNVPSTKIFEELGFVRIRNDQSVNYYELKL